MHHDDPGPGRRPVVSDAVGIDPRAHERLRHRYERRETRAGGDEQMRSLVAGLEGEEPFGRPEPDARAGGDFPEVGREAARSDAPDQELDFFCRPGGRRGRIRALQEHAADIEPEGEVLARFEGRDASIGADNEARYRWRQIEAGHESGVGDDRATADRSTRSSAPITPATSARPAQPVAPAMQIRIMAGGQPIISSGSIPASGPSGLGLASSGSGPRPASRAASSASSWAMRCLMPKPRGKDGCAPPVESSKH